MKKYIFFFGLLFHLEQKPFDLSAWLEFKPSYFFFVAEPMHAIYRHGGFQLQASTSVPMHRFVDFYASVGYRQAWGHALNTKEDTTIKVVPVDLGLKFIETFRDSWFYFLTIGPRGFYVQQKNKTETVDAKASGGFVGFFTNFGCNKEFDNGCLLGLFAEYSYEKKAICPTMDNVYSNGPVQIGGIALGFSAGYAF